MGHATGPPLPTAGLSQVTLWAMQQVGLDLKCDYVRWPLGPCNRSGYLSLKILQMRRWNEINRFIDASHYCTNWPLSGHGILRDYTYKHSMDPNTDTKSPYAYSRVNNCHMFSKGAVVNLTVLLTFRLINSVLRDTTVVHSVTANHKSSSSYSAWDCGKSGQPKCAASPNQPKDSLWTLHTESTQYLSLSAEMFTF